MERHADRRLCEAEHVAGAGFEPLPTGKVQQAGVGYDVARAKKLLTEAGYKGQPIRITTNSRFPVMNDVAVLVQAMGQQVGLNLSVEVVEFAAQLSRYGKGDYQLMVWNYTPYRDPVPWARPLRPGDKATRAR